MTVSDNKKPQQKSKKKKVKKIFSAGTAALVPVIQKDILVLEQNTQGLDIIIGDVHGAKSLLQKLIAEKLQNSHNRLFIVGDLVDRGEDSFGVIQLIEQVNKKRREQGLADQIYVVCGNHEARLLDFYKTLTNSSKASQVHRKKVFVGNGGDWVKQLGLGEVKQALDYIKTLPYIIHVKGKRPFHIVHADMPIHDFALQDRIKQGAQLYPDEKKYAVWARKNSAEIAINAAVVGRTPYSVPAFCGHSVVAEITENNNGRQRCETNMVNLDGMACFTGAFLTVEISRTTGMQCQLFVGDKPTVYYRHIDETQQSTARDALKTMPSMIDGNLQAAYKNHKKATGGFVKYNATQLDSYIQNTINALSPAAVGAQSKKLYIEKLRQIIDYLSPEKKQEFAQYLIQNLDKHMLAKERHWFRWHKHSIETRSVHIVLNMLGAVQKTAGKFVVQDEQTSYELTRHVKLFR